jgi:hypothetical protein
MVGRAGIAAWSSGGQSKENTREFRRISIASHGINRATAAVPAQAVGTRKQPTTSHQQYHGRKAGNPSPRIFVYCPPPVQSISPTRDTRRSKNRIDSFCVALDLETVSEARMKSANRMCVKKVLDQRCKKAGLLLHGAGLEAASETRTIIIHQGSGRGRSARERGAYRLGRVLRRLLSWRMRLEEEKVELEEIARKEIGGCTVWVIWGTVWVRYFVYEIRGANR